MRFVAAVGGFRPSPLTFVAMAACVAAAVVVLTGFSSPPRNGVLKVSIPLPRTLPAKGQLFFGTVTDSIECQSIVGKRQEGR